MRYLLVTCSLFLAVSCTREAWHAPMARPPDTLTVPAGVSFDKLKARTVILQLGTGNTATTTDKVKADAVASGAGSTATASAKKGPPVWVYFLLLGVGAAAWEYGSRYVPAAWLPWRVRPG